jgi:hypothetical protein
MLHGPCGSRNGPDEVFGRHRVLTVPEISGIDVPEFLEPTAERLEV